MWKYTLFGHAVLALSNSRFSNSTTTTLSASNSPQISSSMNSPIRIQTSDSLAASSSSSPSSPAVSSTQQASSSSSSSPNGSTSAGACTGCILQANNPVTTEYNELDASNPWTSTVVTETILTRYITYYDGSKIDTVVTQKQTVDQTKTVIGNSSQTITHTTPTFTYEATPGITLTFTAGSTYVIYDGIYGGLNRFVESTNTVLAQTSTSCASPASTLISWQPTATEDWSYFVKTYTTPPPGATIPGGPSSLPPNLIGFLKQEPSIIANFSGSDIATCTQEPIRNPLTLIPAPHRTIPFFLTRPPEITTETFLSTTYASTSTHESRQGCLRCQNTNSDSGPIPTDQPNNPITPDGQPTPGQSVTIGTRVFPVNTGLPAQPSNAPDGQSQNPPVVVIGSETLTPGQTKTIDGVPVIMPTDVGGSSIVIGGSTIAISPAGPTGPPVITVESKPITADSQGQFIIGSQTLIPGGPAITDNGNTFSLAPSGTIAVINGVTTSLANAPALTPVPVLVVNGQSVTAVVDKGTTQFVLGPGQTLTPGAALTISGTTYSMPASASGSVVVINGVTSTLSNPAVTAAPVLTINGKTYSATVQDGTTQYVFGVGTTLKPGDAVTISGTTYSLDSKGTALVINGQTSSIPRTPASNSASVTQSSSSLVSSVSSTTSRNAGDKIASGIGSTKKSTARAAHSMQPLGFDKWVEGLVVGTAGWLLMWL